MKGPRQLLASLAILSLALSVAAIGGGRAAAAPLAGPDRAFFVLPQVGHDVGGPIHAAPTSAAARQQHVLPLNPGGVPAALQLAATTDSAVQTSATTPLGTIDLLNFDGVGVGITPGYADCCAPPDTNLAVGATQVVQWVNLDFAAFDKATGALLSGPTAGNSVWAGFSGGNCATNNDGDPTVQYDKLAGRWVMTQFSVTGGPPYFQCVAVSNTSNFVTTTWNRYAFSFGNQFPDYPKLGVWPDAYYMSFNLFLNGSTFSGAAACAFDRSAMQAGQPTNGQCFTMGSGVASMLPSDLDGATGALGSTQRPPAGSPDFFLNFGSNSLNIWKFHVDFANSSRTTMTGPTTLAVPSFAEACGGGTCIPQRNVGQRLDSLGDRLMYRLAYRNFGPHESLVVTHSVQGSGTSAPRWYELRSNTATAPGAFSVYQRSSYAPDATYRWLGSAAMDKNGNLALGYSASSTSIYPAILYSGRAAGDPL
ncbi:MAG TPA: hypothetical protein VGS17_08255, partial [Candidatus Limnocylindria bacterium]|nr:hypothetical protein [Candidatus Limnocylindria bacterium]